MTCPKSHSRRSERGSVVSDSLQPHVLYSGWNSPGQNTTVGSLSLLQGIFPAQGFNLGLPHCRQNLYQLSYQGCPSQHKSYIISMVNSLGSLTLETMTLSLCCVCQSIRLLNKQGVPGQCLELHMYDHIYVMHSCIHMIVLTYIP